MFAVFYVPERYVILSLEASQLGIFGRCPLELARVQVVSVNRDLTRGLGLV
jgi:hypothetical protein